MHRVSLRKKDGAYGTLLVRLASVLSFLPHYTFKILMKTQLLKMLFVQALTY